MTFALSVATNNWDESLLKINLVDFKHNARSDDEADLVDHTLSNFLQPGEGIRFIKRACLDLRYALLTGSPCADQH